MALSPVEIRHLTFARRLFGYKQSAVDRTLTEVAESFEDVWRDRADLADKVEQLENDLTRYRELETLLQTTLVTAERSAGDQKEQARREADIILAEAHAQAREVALQAHEQHARLVVDTRRLKAMLESALAALDQADLEPEADGEDEDPAGWQDTGEWAA
ncbi:MAG: DivIVA domain-containing protein [Gaiellaceae bacterium]